MNSKKIEKIKTLFLNIQQLRQDKTLSLNKAIEKVCNLLNLKKESARNYYYKSLNYLRQNPNIASSLGINLNNFKQKSFEKFDNNKKQDMFNFIFNNLKQGKSVRQSCMELANNNAKLMLRYQNKFRNMQKQKNKKGENSSMQQNVINITKAKKEMNKKITESEINALFLGLVKIIKKSAQENADEELKTEVEEATQNFRQTLIDLNKKEVELKNAIEVNKQLNLKIENQQQQICLLLDKLSKRKLGYLEKKSKQSSLKLKDFNKKDKTNNIL